jgi:hypothetical protein
MTRKRYRLTSNPDFQLLHYMARPLEPKINVQLHLAKCYPRDPGFFQKLSKGSIGNAATSPVFGQKKKPATQRV